VEIWRENPAKLGFATHIPCFHKFIQKLPWKKIKKNSCQVSGIFIISRTNAPHGAGAIQFALINKQVKTTNNIGGTR
jgi:hypothetical protein